MPDENKPIVESKMDPAMIKKLEEDLKSAYKEKRFADVKKIADMIKKSDPQNHLADRIIEKTEKEIAEQIKKNNADKIKNLETLAKNAYKEGQLMDIAKIAGEMKKVDPENSVIRSIEKKIDKAKAVLDEQVKKERIRGLEIQIKDILKNGNPEDSVKKANELIKLDMGNSLAMKALKKAAEVKKTDIKTLIDVQPVQNSLHLNEIKKEVEPKVVEAEKKVTAAPMSQDVKKDTKPEEKKGFFARLFGKNEKPAETVKVSAPLAAKDVVKPMTPVVVKPAVSTPEKKDQGKEKVKVLEETLKTSLKDKNEVAAKEAIKSILEIEPDNKSAKKAQEKMDEERKQMEKKVLEEKIKGLTDELKALMKNQDLDKASEKANELLKAEADNKYAAKSLKEIAELKNKKLAVVTPQVAVPETKKGMLNQFIKGMEKSEPVKPAVQTVQPEKKEETAIKAQMPEVKKAEPIQPVAPKIQESGLFGRIMSKMSKQQEEPVKPAVQTVQPEKKEETAIKAQMPEVKKAEPVQPAQMPVKAEPVKTSEVSQVSQKSFSAPAPSIIQPSIPPKPPVTAFKPAVSPQISLSPKQETAQSVKSAVEQGNIFTKLFSKKDETTEKQSGSIIETIVAQANKEKNAVQSVRKEDDDTDESFLRFSRLFLKFSMVFMIMVSGFFYIFNIDTNNTVMSLFGQENNAVKLKNAADELNDEIKQKSDVEKEIDKYKKGYENEYRKVIDNIVKNRMDWPKLIKQLNEVTESVYEKNALSKYVQYNNYSYDVATGRLSVSGTLSDPLGKNLTKLAELEEAFTYYPKDKNDPNDTRTPYFYNMQEFRSFDKAFNRAIGRYISNFNLTLSTKQVVKKSK